MFDGAEMFIRVQSSCVSYHSNRTERRAMCKSRLKTENGQCEFFVTVDYVSLYSMSSNAELPRGSYNHILVLGLQRVLSGGLSIEKNEGRSGKLGRRFVNRWNECL